MLLANRKVAGISGFVPGLSTGCMTSPILKKISNLPFISRFGYSQYYRSASSRKHEQAYGKVAGKNEQNIIETLAIRSMSGGIFNEEHGHYGLAFKHYTHYSPIRRYPDMLVHRLLTVISQQ